MTTLLDELKEKYEKTHNGKWYVKDRYALGNFWTELTSDVEGGYFNGSHIASFVEFRKSDAEFCAFVHNNMPEILDKMKAVK